MSSILILERSIKAATAAAAAVAKASAELTAMTSTAEGLANSIEDQEAKLAELKAKNDTAFREGAAELRLRVKEDADTVLAELLKSNGLADISNEELAALRKQVETLLAKDDADLKAAVASAVAQSERVAKAAALEVDAKYRVETASKDAAIQQMQAQLAFMGQQVTDLRKQIDDERNTRLEIAKADAGRQGTVVNTGK